MAALVVLGVMGAIASAITFVTQRDEVQLADPAAVSPSGLSDPTAAAGVLPTDAASTAAEGVEPCRPTPPPTDVGQKLTYPDGPALGQLIGGSAYEAVIETTCGRMVYKLLEDVAPEAVNSFVFLAREGFFDGLQIFRNEPSISILQSGAGDNTNTFDIGYALPDELGGAEALGYTTGSLAMANSGPDNAGSQFFMVYGESSV